MNVTCTGRWHSVDLETKPGLTIRAALDAQGFLVVEAQQGDKSDQIANVEYGEQYEVARAIAATVASALRNSRAQLEEVSCEKEPGAQWGLAPDSAFRRSCWPPSSGSSCRSLRNRSSPRWPNCRSCPPSRSRSSRS